MIDKIIKERWQKSATGYSEVIRKELETGMGKVWKNYLESHLPPKKGLDILDIGCGPGFFSIILGKEHQVTGIDVSENMIQEAKKNAKVAGVDSKFQLMDSHHLHFGQKGFDVIVSRNVVWTLYNPESAYSQWSKFLKKNGQMLIFDANWNLPLYEEELMKAKKKDEACYLEKYGLMQEACNDLDLREQLDRKVPLGNVKRPQWDQKVLETLGYEVQCDLNAGEDLWDEGRKLRYRTTPLFMICARKKSEE